MRFCTNNVKIPVFYLDICISKSYKTPKSTTVKIRSVYNWSRMCVCVFDQQELWNTFEICISNIENQQFQLPILFRLLDAQIGLVPVKLYGYHLKTTPLLLLFCFTF